MRSVSRLRVVAPLGVESALMRELARGRPAALLAHMSPVYVLLAAPLLRPLRVPMLLWFTQQRGGRLRGGPLYRPLPRLHGVVQSINDGQLQVADAPAWLHREKCSRGIERDNVDPGQTLNNGGIDHDQRTSVSDSHQLSIWSSVPRRVIGSVYRPLKHADNRTRDVPIDSLQAAHDIDRQRQRDELTRTAELGGSPSTPPLRHIVLHRSSRFTARQPLTTAPKP